MKLKYYLRGLGIGVVVTTVILMIGFHTREVKISDEEIIARAESLGMVMSEDAVETVNETERHEEKQPSDKSGDAKAQKDADGSKSKGKDTPAETEGKDTPVETEEKDTPVETDDNGDSQQAADDGAASTESQNPVAGDRAEGEPYRLVINPGDVCRVVCEKLQENGVISDAEALRTYLFEIGYASNMSIGEYDIPYGLTNEEIAQILQAGPLEDSR